VLDQRPYGFQRALFFYIFFTFLEIGRLPDLKSDFNSMSDFELDVSQREMSHLGSDVSRVNHGGEWELIPQKEEKQQCGLDVRFEIGRLDV